MFRIQEKRGRVSHYNLLKKEPSTLDIRVRMRTHKHTHIRTHAHANKHTHTLYT